MAHRNSARSSRRNIPQPAPEIAPKSTLGASPQKVSRVTRSQSRDISDGEGGTFGRGARRNRKQASSNDENSNTVKNTLEGRKGRPANHSRALQELSMVAEDQSVIYPDLQTNDNQDVEPALEVQDSLQRRDVQDTKSPGGVSAFSGTTARTSRSALEVANLDAEDLLDALPALIRSSDELLRFLIPDEFTEEKIAKARLEIQSKETRANKNFLRLRKTFQVQRDVFGSDSLIEPSQILGILVGIKNASDVPAEPWRPDILLQKTNLAILASSILSYPKYTEVDGLWHGLNQKFPSYFMEGFEKSADPSTGHSSLSEETFQLALDIRTQYVIMQMRSFSGQPNFDFDVIIMQVFYTDSNSLRGWNFVGYRSGALKQSAELATTQRIQAIRRVCNQKASSDSQQDVDVIKHMSKEYPWDAFLYQCMHWIRERLDEFGMQIAKVGGGDAILSLLNEEFRRRKAAGPSSAEAGDGSPEIHLQYDLPSETSYTPSQKPEKKTGTTRVKQLKSATFSAKSPKSIRLLKHLQQSEAKEEEEALKAIESADALISPAFSSEVQVAATAVPLDDASTPERRSRQRKIPSSAPAKTSNKSQQIQDEDWRPQQDDDDSFEENLSNINPPEIARRVLAIRNEREAESNKENLLEIPGSQFGQAKSLLDPQANAHTIQWDSSDSQPTGSQDEDLQTRQPVASSSRSMKISNKRPATAPLRNQHEPPKKVRPQQDPLPPRDHDDEFDDDNESIAGPRRTQERPLRPSQVHTYNEANSLAKERVALRNKTVQTRRAWTENETQTLLDLIVDYGTSWAQLKRADDSDSGLLKDRGQVALKDKARNMKFDYLKAGKSLPRNFENIPLSKIQIDRLRDLGLEYDRVTRHRVDGEFGQ